MSFNSITFVFWFLPIILILYFISDSKIKPGLLLVASLFVCAWGGTQNLLFLIGFILVNWAFGFLLEKHEEYLALAVVADIAFLLLFKFFGLTPSLPLGISFYTFSGISYCTDVARKDVKPAKNIIKFALYLSFFPKFVMGPIVKYKDIERQLDSLSTNHVKVSHGMYKFTIGFAKKLIMASNLAEMTNYCWIDAPQSVASAWLGIIGYTLQLYYDFSGYSDMAIGLAEIFGFDIKENFTHPYESTSVSEFWGRWHISLGQWFKDYVYIPLGGNRLGLIKTCDNLLLVWIATGLWHGTGFNFICWGLFICIFVMIEKLFPALKKLPKFLRILASDFIVMIGWVFFNSASVNDALLYMGYMFGNAETGVSGIASMYFNKLLPFLLIAVLGITSFPRTAAKQIFGENTAIATIFKCIFMLGLLAASVYYLVNLGFTPFIYQSF